MSKAAFNKFWCDHSIERPKRNVCDGASGYLYFTGGGSSYHATPECKALRKGQAQVDARGGAPEQVQAVRTIRSTNGRRPCRTCKPVEAAAGVKPPLRQAPRDGRPAVRTDKPRVIPGAGGPVVEPSHAYRYDVGPVQLIVIGTSIPVRGKTNSDASETGVQYVVQVKGPGLDLDIVDSQWDNLERDVRIGEVRVGPDDIKDLVNRCRVGVYRPKSGLIGFRLRLPRRIDADRRPTLHKTSLSELQKVTGLDVRALLLDLGAESVNRQKVVLGPAAKQPEELYVAFRDPQDESLIPIVACCVTHVLPFVSGKASGSRTTTPASTPTGQVRLSDAETERLLAYLDGRVCRVCRQTPKHVGCREAAELHRLLSARASTR